MTTLKLTRFTAFATVPLCLLLAGCNDTNTGTDSDRASAGAPNVDNTAKNVRDRDDATLTPGDQGTSAADREVTQKIRKSLVIDATGYSTTAKNIKIMTVDGKVTLRGPVPTDAEKTGIAKIATSVAGEGNVDNQLEIMAKP